MVQFSLRRLLLGVTAVAIVAGLARVAPVWMALAIASGLSSVGCLALATSVALLDDRRHPVLVASCVLLISLPLFLLGVVLGILCVWACLQVMLTVMGI